MSAYLSQIKLTLRWAIRDRLFYAVLGVALLLLLLVPVLSSFSMRQVQELSLTLALSFNALFLLVLGVLLGTSTLWREIERRYTHAVLTLPISRGSFLLGKFTGLAFFLILCTFVLALVAALVVMLSSATYPSETPIAWGAFVLAVLGDGLKAILVAALAMLFSTLATSFYLPFFVTLAIYFAGSATQEVFEYLQGKHGEQISPLVLWVAKGLYFLLPNFSAFNYKVQAIYALPVSSEQVMLTLVYFVVYGGLVLGFALFIFGRRQFS